MNCYQLINVDNGKRRVAFDRKTLKPRPVDIVTNKTSHQITYINDVVIEYNKGGNIRVHYFMGHNGAITVSRPSDVARYLNDCMTPVIKDWLLSDSIVLPAGVGWDGISAGKDLLNVFNLDKFFEVWNTDSVLQELSNQYHPDYISPSGQIALFSESLIMDNIVKLPVVEKAADEKARNRILDKLPEAYKEFIHELNDGKNYVDASRCDFRRAKPIGRVAYIHGLWTNESDDDIDDLAMASEIITVDDKDNVKLYSMVDFMKSMRPMDCNLISFPVFIQENIKQVIMVVHNFFIGWTTWHLFKPTHEVLNSATKH